MNGDIMISGAILIFAGIYETTPLGKWVFVAGILVMFNAMIGTLG